MSLLAFTQTMGFWIAVATIAGVLILHAEVSRLVAEIDTHYQDQLEITRLREEFALSQADAVLLRQQNAERQFIIDQFEQDQVRDCN